MPVTTGGGSSPSNPWVGVAANNSLGTVSLEYFTVSLWHRWITVPQLNSGYAEIVSLRGRSGANPAWIKLDGGSGGNWGTRFGSVGLQTWNGGYSPAVNTGIDDIEEGRWYHYAIVGDGANGTKAYQDGVEVLSNDNTLIGIGDVESIRCPNNSYSNQSAEAQIAHIKYWDVALTQAEIASEMSTGEPFRLSNIKCWRPLLDDKSDYLGILSDQGLDGTFGGSVPVAWHRQNSLYAPSTSAGSVGPIDTRPTFKIVRVNMYN